MPNNITVLYKGQNIYTSSDSGSVTLQTNGTFMESDVNLDYTFVDLSDTTVTSNDVLSGKYFYTADGVKTQGNIVTKTASDLSASGKTVTVPAGYYASQVTKDVATGSATTPATTITTNPTISVNSSGLITATNSKTQSITPTVSAGYVSSGTAGTITVSGSNTSQLTTQAAQTITPTTTDQTIASGKYLTGAQTIKGDANLVAANIAEGVTIFGVQGTHSGGGGGSVSANAVNFRDYDGTIVAAYSGEDFAALTAMPANPSHEGLTAQGWNWTLAKAKAYVAKYGKLEIGQMYITDDGKTRVYIHLEQGRTSPMLGCCPNGTVDVDWGDGSAHDTLTGTSETTVQWTQNHAYAAPGDYVIKLTVTGSMGFYGNSQSNQYSGLLRYTSSMDSKNYVYRNAIQKVEIGSSVTSIGSSAFYYCYSLASVTIPDSVTSIDSSAFSTCYSLASVTIPDSVTSIDSTAFQGCSSLLSVNISDSVTSIGGNAFYYCYSLASVTIPDSVTSIGNSAFGYCYSLASVTIPDSVTSLGSSALSTCYSLASVTIPDSLTSIGSSVFYSCYSLASVTIPDSVTSIGSKAFSTCYSVAEYHLARTTPPTLANTNAFTSIAADCVIYVPYSADHSILEAYKTASNWSTYASKMQEEPQ